MMRTTKNCLATITVMIGCLLFYGCLANKTLRLSDSELYQLGFKQFNDKKYIKSRETFTLLVDYYPDSSFAAEAQLLKADAFYKEKNYIEAEVEYNLFLEFHPAHPKADYALYQEADCNYYHIKSIDRDQTNVTDTVKKLKKLIALYPDSEYVSKAKERIEECQKLIHEHSLYVARFYHRWERYISSIERYEYLASATPPISEELRKTVETELAMVRQDYFDFLNNRAVKYWEKGNHKAAVILYEKLLEYFPERENDEIIVYRIAASYFSIEEYDKAEMYFQKIIDNFPNGVYKEKAEENLDLIEKEKAEESQDNEAQDVKTE